jgi:hypothetical protein
VCFLIFPLISGGSGGGLFGGNNGNSNTNTDLTQVNVSGFTK